MRGLGPVLSVLDTILAMEAFMANKGIVRIENQKLHFDKLVVDCTELCCTLSSGVRLLACGSVVTLQKRKSTLRPYLDQKYHYLLRPTKPVTELLLGLDLEQKINDSTKMFEVSKKLATGDRVPAHSPEQTFSRCKQILL